VVEDDRSFKPGRAIVATRFGSGARRVLYVGGVHGNEYGTAVATKFVSYLIAHPNAVAFGARIEVVRCLNPDGLVHHTRGNARRVDLNRNLPAHDWRGRLYPASEPPGSNLTGGSGPGSEPETKALLAQDRPLRLFTAGRTRLRWSRIARSAAQARLCGLPLRA
jgi:predicted deacylase